MLANVREQRYGPARLAQGLGYSYRAAAYWGTPCLPEDRRGKRRVPPAVLGLALALTHLEPEEIAVWRADLRVLRS